ncbi:hypothetical protein PC129_g11160 [Phytophthora cactorum]|uniref:RxLR effector protein n=1 Tax=Phytophthora cactorum TaxID=29920 RepID=A0A8T1E752_9STRA|nr:hypothetical protein Pcac1_g25642 [Phytophthora cactorum]KAG2834152.1 hypothetical protein PC112_g6194 [Phytophthora cactorum]KAG2836596.1 hypothetical protein PC111_g4981 [Phytophthora cactorum]KAG2862442.1 hypothetical protein PC113_g6296 [Phytophthora cactorum]KAG2900526.1 hypothetical protein PC114_g13510 [Phytophthora cactorum]
MQRLLLVVMALLLVAMALVSASSGSFGVVEKDSGNSTTTVGGTQNTTVFQPADDFLPKSNGGHGNGNDEASKAGVKAPRDGNGGMVVCAWRASRREEEAMFMDLGDERSYTYGRFGDYAAM